MADDVKTNQCLKCGARCPRSGLLQARVAVSVEPQGVPPRAGSRGRGALLLALAALLWTPTSARAGASTSSLPETAEVAELSIDAWLPSDPGGRRLHAGSGNDVTLDLGRLRVLLDTPDSDPFEPSFHAAGTVPLETYRYRVPPGDPPLGDMRAEVRLRHGIRVGDLDRAVLSSTDSSKPFLRFVKLGVSVTLAQGTGPAGSHVLFGGPRAVPRRLCDLFGDTFPLVPPRADGATSGGAPAGGGPLWLELDVEPADGYAAGFLSARRTRLVSDMVEEEDDRRTDARVVQRYGVVFGVGGAEWLLSRARLDPYLRLGDQEGPRYLLRYRLDVPPGFGRGDVRLVELQRVLFVRRLPRQEHASVRWPERVVGLRLAWRRDDLAAGGLAASRAEELLSSQAPGDLVWYGALGQSSR